MCGFRCSVRRVATGLWVVQEMPIKQHRNAREREVAVARSQCVGIMRTNVW